MLWGEGEGERVCEKALVKGWQDVLSSEHVPLPWQYRGGAIEFQNAASNVSISGSHFTNNYAEVCIVAWAVVRRMHGSM